MSAPDPDSVSLATKVIASLAAVVAPVWGARTWLDRRFEKKADKAATVEQFKAVSDNLELHRGYFAKVFDQMRENEQRAQDRHERVMERLSK